MTAATAIPISEIARQRSLGWPDFHPEDYCHRCGVANPLWFTDRESWLTATAAWAAETGREGICCPRCFFEMHEAAVGEAVIWEIAARRSQGDPMIDPAHRERDLLRSIATDLDQAVAAHDCTDPRHPSHGGQHTNGRCCPFGNLNPSTVVHMRRLRDEIERTLAKETP